MKANEAPEKLYMNWVNYPLEEMQVEYTRTDAFIEKAENFIYSALNDGIMGTCNIEDFLRLFKNYIKGE